MISVGLVAGLGALGGFIGAEITNRGTYCSNCGGTIKKEAEICTECGVRQKGAAGAEIKNAMLSALLSFLFTGCGQIYNGQTGKGITLIVAQYINYMLMIVVIGFLTYPATLAYATYDAYNVANKINDGEIKL